MSLYGLVFAHESDKKSQEVASGYKVHTVKVDASVGVRRHPQFVVETSTFEPGLVMKNVEINLEVSIQEQQHDEVLKSTVVSPRYIFKAANLIIKDEERN